MAFMSNQWLKTDKERARGSSPCGVDLQVTQPDGKFERENGVVLEVEGFRPDGNYQYVLFTEQDIERLAYAVLGSDTAREVLIRAIAARGSDELLALVERLAVLNREQSQRT